MRVLRIVVLLLGIVVIAVIPARAQGTTGTVCVSVYNDSNKNQAHDSTEPLLTDIDVDLMAGQNVVIANHITDGKEPYCFNNLVPRQYALSVNSPFYVATSPSVYTFTLAADDQINKEFGMVAGTASNPDFVPSDSLNNALSTPIRLGIAAIGALVVMVFMVAVGMIVYGLFFRR
jgi:hypothetical protein